jgi:hypothetical protein
MSYVFWISSTLLHLALALVMRNKRSSLRLEFFYAYIVFKICRSAVLFVTYHASSGPAYYTYFWLFWLSEFVEIPLSIAVIYELYENTLAEYEAIRKASGILFRWAAVILILVGAIAVASSPAADSSRVMVGILSIKQAGTIVCAGLLLLLFLAGNVLGLRWKHYVFGIALGFALHASVELVVIAVRARLGTVTPIWPIVDGVAYHCALLIWITYLFSRERSQATSTIEYPLHELERWNDSVREIIGR